MTRRDALPPSLQPRGLSRTESAAYIGVGCNLFDQMVADGRMPPPKRINTRNVWDRHELDDAFDALPANQSGRAAENPWDTIPARVA